MLSMRSVKPPINEQFFVLHISKTGLCDDAICDWPKCLIVIFNKNKNKNNSKNKNSNNILFCIDTLFQITELKFIVTIDNKDDNNKNDMINS